MTFALTLDSAPSSAVTVNYVTATGTAGTSDYTSTSGSVTFAAGQTSQFVTIATTEDSAFEADETFTVTFSGSSLTASVTATGTIANDDADPSTQAQTFALTAAANTFSGAGGNDTINGVLSGTAANNTLNGLDIINGGAGDDTLNILDETGGQTVPGVLSMSGVETVNVRSAAAATIDLTGAGISGVTTLNATQSAAATLTAASTTNVNVSGATGAITVDGGKDISVTDATKDTDITIGATTVGAGSVTVNATSAGASTVAVDGGTSVTLNIAGTTGGGGDTITVGNGGAATDLPSGVVSVTSAHTGVAATDVSLNAITVKGGSTVTVTQTSDTSKAATDTTGATLTQGDVTVVAGTATTSVTVAQATKVTEVVSVAASQSVTETASVQFSALNPGQTLILGGLTFTASVAMTAAEAAAAFANLTNGTLPAAGDSQSGGAASKGTYTGVFTGWTSGAVSTDTVVFTSTTASVNVANLANTGSGTATVTTTGGTAAGVAEVQTIDLTGVTAGANGNFTVGGVTVAVLAADNTQDIADKVVTALNAVAAGSAIGDATATNAGGTSPIVTITYDASWGNVTQASVTNGTATLSGLGTSATTTAGGAVTAKSGVLGVNTGVVLIDDNTTAASITTISIDGYKTGSRLGTTTDTTALSSLTLKNADSGSTLTVDDTAATLALTLQAMGSSTTDAVLTFTNAPTTLNVTSTGANYVNLTAAATETLNVSGTGLLDIDTTDLAGLLAVTVTGSAGVKLNAGVSNTLTSINASGTTGAITTSIDGAVATYTGSSGVDTVTLATSTALTKSIDLGAGDDTLTLVALTTGSTATLSGGAGTDTLSMTTATAAALDDAAQTFYTGFERLTINNAAGSANIDLANLGFTNYVTTAGSSGTLTLSNLASGGTVVATVAPTTGYTVVVKDAATGTADALNFVISASAGFNAGTITAANVETVNLTATDTVTTAITAHTAVLTADSATAVTVAGNAGISLTMTGSTKVTSINASTATGAVTVTSLNTTSATTITGGSGNDVLQAATGSTADVLIGGAGQDKLTTNQGLTSLTGGAGNDLFKIGVASLSSNSYSTISDFGAGDLIEFTGATSFVSASISLADTAVFQDYANAAVNAITVPNNGINGLAWFQYNGNTYIVMDAAGGGAADSTSFINGEDFIVRLTGLVDLTNASFNSDYGTIAL